MFVTNVAVFPPPRFQRPTSDNYLNGFASQMNVDTKSQSPEGFASQILNSQQYDYLTSYFYSAGIKSLCLSVLMANNVLPQAKYSFLMILHNPLSESKAEATV